MTRLPQQALRRAVTRHARAATLSALLPLAAATVLAAPAQAAPPCQAIDATSILSSTPPGPNCTTQINPGDTFSIDFSSVFTSNPGDFALTNTYSLQIANIGQGTLDFEDVQLLVTGDFDSGTASGTFNNQPIAIWTDTPGSFAPTGQGISNYTPSVSGGPFFPGGPTAYESASFSLTSPVMMPPFGVPAGLINTFPIKLSDVGVTSFTSARIVGKLKATSAFGPFSAGLGIFTSNSPTTGVPNIIYGNAFNVPGPLPIVGAGAAFGWSRRLRHRVRKAKASAATSLV